MPSKLRPISKVDMILSRSRFGSALDLRRPHVFAQARVSSNAVGMSRCRSRHRRTNWNQVPSRSHLLQA